MKALMLLGAFNGAAAIMLGAFGAHGLKARVDEAMLGVWSTASTYHFLHALALLLIAILAKQFTQDGTAPTGFIAAGWVMFFGMLAFSGSLYALVLSGQRILGAITPIGGTVLIIAWLMLAWAIYKNAA